MDKKFKIVVGVGLTAGTVAGAYYLGKRELKVDERSKNNMLNTKGAIEEKFVEGACVNEEPIKELLPIEVEKINGMIRGMSEQELRVVLQNIPVGLMFDEIGARLAAHEQFAMHIQDALNCLPR